MRENFGRDGDIEVNPIEDPLRVTPYACTCAQYDTSGKQPINKLKNCSDIFFVQNSTYMDIYRLVVLSIQISNWEVVENSEFFSNLPVSLIEKSSLSSIHQV